MIALRVSCGFDITLNLKDKEKASRGELLECNLDGQKDQKVVLHVRKVVPWKGHMEEPGFHIRATPKYPCFKRTYDIYLSKEIFCALTNPTEHPIVDGGYFVSRSMLDRVDIKYFAL